MGEAEYEQTRREITSRAAHAGAQAGIHAAGVESKAGHRSGRLLWSVVVALALATVALGGGVVWNTARDSTRADCQAGINEQYRVDATERAEITTQDRVALDAWISSVAVALNGVSGDPVTSLAALQSATVAYTQARAANDLLRQDHPLDPLTGKC